MPRPDGSLSRPGGWPRPCLCGLLISLEYQHCSIKARCRDEMAISCAQTDGCGRACAAFLRQRLSWLHFRRALYGRADGCGCACTASLRQRLSWLHFRRALYGRTDGYMLFPGLDLKPRRMAMAVPVGLSSSAKRLPHSLWAPIIVPILMFSSVQFRLDRQLTSG